MSDRWRKVWSWSCDDWTDVVFDEPSLHPVGEVETGDDDSDDDVRRSHRLTMYMPFTLRCAPGRWRVDIRVEPRAPGSRRVDVLEGRLRRHDDPRLPWNWQKLARGSADSSCWAIPYGTLPLNGGTVGLCRVREVDAYLRANQTTSDELYRGLYRDAAGRRYLNGRSTVTQSCGGAAVRIQEPGDLDVLVAVCRPSSDQHAQLGWSIDY